MGPGSRCGCRWSSSSPRIHTSSPIGHIGRMNTLAAMDERDLDPDPLKQFERWFAEARDAGLAAPEAMALATATPDGRPSVRMVLLKERRRARLRLLHALREPEGRRARGEPSRGAPLPLAAARPPGSHRRAGGPHRGRGVGGVLRHAAAREPPRRLGLTAEPHRSTSRDELERLYADAKERFPGAEVPLPPHWGGFRLEPDCLRVLAARRRPAARPGALRARGWSLAASPARALGVTNAQEHVAEAERAERPREGHAETGPGADRHPQVA